MRIFEVIDLRPEVTDRPDAIDMPPIEGEIKFEDVSFHYVPDVDVIKDVEPPRPPR